MKHNMGTVDRLLRAFVIAPAAIFLSLVMSALAGVPSHSTSNKARVVPRREVRKMRRFAIAAALVAVGVLVVRVRLRNLHERLAARCEAMFDRMPDTFPPKKMMHGIEETRVQTTRILELLEARNNESGGSEGADGFSDSEVHHAA